MIVHRPRKRGKGILNKIINNLPVELHLPGYQYCGPGTKLAKRLSRGDPGINPLDSACKQHDIAYSKHREDIEARHKADKALEYQAWSRVNARDAGIGEKAAALFVTNAMKAKTSFGMGMKKGGENKKRKVNRRKRKTKKRKVSLRKIVKAAKNSIKLDKGAQEAIKTALQGARVAVKLVGGKCQVTIPRVLPVPPKIGGILPFLIPLFAGLSATGALAGGAAGIAQAVNKAKAARLELDESKRHNQAMEALALGKGLCLKPYKQGMGLFLKPKNL